MFEQYEKHRADNFTDPELRQACPISMISGWENVDNKNMSSSKPNSSKNGSLVNICRSLHMENEDMQNKYNNSLMTLISEYDESVKENALEDTSFSQEINDLDKNVFKVANEILEDIIKEAICLADSHNYDGTYSKEMNVNQEDKEKREIKMNEINDVINDLVNKTMIYMSRLSTDAETIKGNKVLSMIIFHGNIS